MKKIFAMLCLAALLFSGCEAVAPTQNTTTALPDTTPSQTTTGETVLWQQEIEAAWYAAHNSELGPWYTTAGTGMGDGVRHYGTYDGYDVIYLPTFDAAMTQKQIGNAVFENRYTFELYAYREGQFYDLQQAYEEGWLTDVMLQQIAQIHAQFQDVLFPTLDEDVLSGDVAARMKAAFLRQYVKEDGWSEKDLTVISYGEYDGAYVAFISGIFDYTQALTSEKVGNLTFHYHTGQKLLVFFDDELMQLPEAYERGILTDESLLSLHKRYHKDDSLVTE